MQAHAAKRIVGDRRLMAALVLPIVLILVLVALVAIDMLDRGETTAPTLDRVDPAPAAVTDQSVVNSDSGTYELPEEAIDAQLRAGQPNAYWTPKAGEGLIGGSNSELHDEATEAQLRADSPRSYWVPKAGEGLIDGSNSGADLRPAVRSHEETQDLEWNLYLPGDTGVPSQDELQQQSWEQESPRSHGTETQTENSMLTER